MKKVFSLEGGIAMMDLMKRNRYKLVIILSLSIVFFSLVISLTYSKFHASFETDTATRTAFFLGDGFSSVPINVEMAPGEERELAIEVSDREGTKRIETSMRYIIELESYGSLPLTYELYKGEDKQNFTNNRAEGTMHVGAQQPQIHNYRLKIVWPKDEKDTVHENNLTAIRLNLRAEQID